MLCQFVVRQVSSGTESRISPCSEVCCWVSFGDATRVFGSFFRTRLGGCREGNLDDILPQPLTDEKVKQEVNGLFAMIDGYTINFYHEYSVSGSARKINPNALPAARPAQTEADLERLLAEPRTRSSVIASIICAKLLDSTSTVGEIDKSLLLPVVTIF